MMKWMVWSLASAWLFACHSSGSSSARAVPSSAAAVKAPPSSAERAVEAPAAAVPVDTNGKSELSARAAKDPGDPSCGGQSQLCSLGGDGPDPGAMEQATAILSAELLRYWGGSDGLVFSKYIEAPKQQPVALTAAGLLHLEERVRASGEGRVVASHLQGMLNTLQTNDSDSRAALLHWAQRLTRAPVGLRIASLGMGGAGPWSGVLTVGCEDAGCDREQVRTLLEEAFRWTTQPLSGPRPMAVERANRFVHIEGVSAASRIGEVDFEALRERLGDLQPALSELYGPRWREHITLLVVARGSHQVETCTTMEPAGTSYCSQDALWAPLGLGPVPGPGPTPKTGAVVVAGADLGSA